MAKQDDRLRAVLAALRAEKIKADPELVRRVLAAADEFKGVPGPAPFGAMAGEAAAVQRMRQLRAGGLSLRLVAERLNEEGVPTRTGAAWSKTTVSVVLGRTAKGE